MSDKTSFLLKEKQNLDETIKLLDDLILKSSLSQYEIIAMGTLLQNIYRGVESILRYRLQEEGIRLRKTENWHKELLKQSFESKFIDEKEFESFLELLLFRHMHVHGYGYMLDENQLKKITNTTLNICKNFLKNIG